MDVIASLDIGHSALKALGTSSNSPGERTRHIFPTCVIPAINLADEGTRTRAEAETVTVRGETYFFGDTAKSQAPTSAFIGENRDWIFTTAHDVLLLGGVKSVLDAQVAKPDRLFLILGLPADNFAAHKEELAGRALDIVSPYLGTVSSSTALHIRVQAQPFGALQNIAFLQTGVPNEQRNLDSEAWGVIDIGHFTTDYLLFEEGAMIQRAFGSSGGVGTVYQQLAQAFGDRSLPNDLKTIDHAIRKGTIKQYGKTIDVGEILTPIVAAYASKVIDEAKRRFGDRLSAMDGILVAGGGAGLVFEPIVQALPHSVLPSDPQFTVAEGFARLGLYLSSR